MDMDTGKSLNALDSIFQAIGSANVTLLDVTIDDYLAVFPDASQEHFHLRRCRVLGFIKDDEGIVVEGLAAHIGQGSSNDTAMTQAVIHHAPSQSLIKDIPEGVYIDGELVLDLAGQESQVFTRFYGRARQDDALDTSRLQCLSGQCTCAVGLSGSGRANTKSQAVVFNGADVLVLRRGAGFEWCFFMAGGVGSLKLVAERVDIDDVGSFFLLSSSVLGTFSFSVF